MAIAICRVLSHLTGWGALSSDTILQRFFKGGEALLLMNLKGLKEHFLL
jgi:hypothetical protein